MLLAFVFGLGFLAPHVAGASSSPNSVVPVPTTNYQTEQACGSTCNGTGNQFGPLEVRVLDSSGQAVPAVTVTFTSPSTGASAIFSSCACQSERATTGPNGVATISDVYENGTQGSYFVTATLASLSTSLSLSNSGDVPWDLLPDLGSTPQSAQVNQSFSQPLRVQLTSYNDADLKVGQQGVPITFTIVNAERSDGSGTDPEHPNCSGQASATFQGNGPFFTKKTDGSGQVSSPPVNANAVAGCFYYVTASVDWSYTNNSGNNNDGAYHPAVFQLWNQTDAPAGVVAVPTTTPQSVPSDGLGDYHLFNRLASIFH
jgi:hypothetical protein